MTVKTAYRHGDKSSHINGYSHLHDAMTVILLKKYICSRCTERAPEKVLVKKWAFTVMQTAQTAVAVRIKTMTVAKNYCHEPSLSVMVRTIDNEIN